MIFIDGHNGLVRSSIYNFLKKIRKIKFLKRINED